MLTKESSRVIESNADLDVARALYECGDFAESAALAKSIYQESKDTETRFHALLRVSTCQSEQRQYSAALKTLNLAGPLLDDVAPKFKANFHGQRAYLKAKIDADNIDDALIDYAAARMFAQEAGDDRIGAQVRNNVAKRYGAAGRFDEAIIEVDAAIRMAQRLDDEILMGRFYDQKAQILIDANQYAAALVSSEKAMFLLTDHSSLTEARTTHGRALVALGAYYLEQVDPIGAFTGKRDASQYVTVSLDANLIKLALDRTGGNVYQAAELLHVKHPSLLGSIKRFKITRSPPRRRAKSLIKNKS